MKLLTPYILTAILGLTLSFNAQAQSPEKFNYQAVLRNNGQLVTSNAVDLRFTIHDGSATGTVVYQETHSTTTDAYGLVNVAVGSGTVVSGTFSSINWGGGSKYLQVEVDYGPGGYDDMGARQLLSVPYALHAGGTTGGGSWSTTGNAGITPAQFIGTIDTADLHFKVNGVSAGIITNNSPYNTSFGKFTLQNNSTGEHNTATGYYALRNNTSGRYNTASGYFALGTNTTGNYNTATGVRALKSNTTGIQNTANGGLALRMNTTGFENTATGYNSLASNTTGSKNTATGSRALYDNTTGNYNTAHGNSALQSNTTGDHNTATGRSALNQNTTGNNNTASGSGTLYTNTTGTYNTATGSGSLSFNTTGNYNTANGALALLHNTTGDHNTAGGFKALAANTTGDNNIASGSFALYSNTTGSENMALGKSAMYSNTTGTDNVAIGFNALYFNTNGDYNTSIGYHSMYDNITGLGNTAQGMFVLNNNTSGSFNTALGYNALGNNTTGDYNTAIGFGADVSTGNLTNATAIGNKAYVGQSNSMILGSINGVNGATEDTWVGIGTTSPTELLEVNGRVKFKDTILFGTIEYIYDSGPAVIGVNGGLHSTIDGFDDLGTATHRWQDVYASNGTIQTSDRRSKTAIKTLDYGLEEIMALHPVRFKWKEMEYQGYKLGIIAQEMLKVLPEVVKTVDWKRQEDGTIKKVKLERLGVYYSDIIPVLIKGMQEQQKMIEKQQKMIEELAARVAELEK